MDYSDKILKEYTEHADMRIAFVCRLMVGFMLLVALLNILGIFKIAPLPLYLTVVISIFDFLLPTLFYNILKMRSEGEDIPRCARCVALADVFDALVSRRAYKSPWLPEEAFREIVSQKGRQFDPEIVDAFVMHYNEFLAVARKYPDN